MKIIFYGAGEYGKEMLDFMYYMNLGDNVIGFCDKNANNIQYIEGKKVYSLEEVEKLEIEYSIVITIAKKEFREEVEKELKERNVFYYSNITEWVNRSNIDVINWGREFCGFFHKRGMNGYFENVERKESIDLFWRKDTEFYKMFCNLDLENVVELACGRGRHVPQYIESARHITLVDILNENIEYCKQRFRDKDNISYYCNNGFNLERLDSNSYSALFTYDAMVHFELIDVYNYLQDIYRILTPGAYALFHHSNNTRDYKLSFENASHGRNYMSKDLFAYLAYRCGFEIIDQKVIDFVEPELDCISLIRKPLKE